MLGLHVAGWHVADRRLQRLLAATRATDATRRPNRCSAPSRASFQLSTARRATYLSSLKSPSATCHQDAADATSMVSSCVAQVLGQPADGGDVSGADAYARFGLDAGAQFEVAQRVQTVLGQRAVRIDRATQNQTDLIGDQAPQPGGPLVRRQRVQLGPELACVRSALGRRTRTPRRTGCVVRRRSTTACP